MCKDEKIELMLDLALQEVKELRIKLNDQIIDTKSLLLEISCAIKIISKAIGEPHVDNCNLVGLASRIAKELRNTNQPLAHPAGNQDGE